MDEYCNLYETASGIEPKMPPPVKVPPFFPGGSFATSAMAATAAGKTAAQSAQAAAPSTPVANWSIYFRAQRNGGGKYKKLYINFHSLNPAEAKALGTALQAAGASLIKGANGGGAKNAVEIDISSVLSSSP